MDEVYFIQEINQLISFNMVRIKVKDWVGTDGGKQHRRSKNQIPQASVGNFSCRSQIGTDKSTPLWVRPAIPKGDVPVLDFRSRPGRPHLNTPFPSSRNFSVRIYRAGAPHAAMPPHGLNTGGTPCESVPGEHCIFSPCVFREECKLGMKKLVLAV